MRNDKRHRKPPQYHLVIWLCFALAGGFNSTASLAGKGPIKGILSLEELLDYEKRLVRKDGETPTLNPADKFGADPYKIRYLPDLKQHLILLRNRSEILLADGSLNLLDRQPTPRSPTGWTLAHQRFLFVSGELSPEIQLYEITAKELLPRGKLRPRGVASVRDLVYVSAFQSLFILDDFGRRLLKLELAPNWLNQKQMRFRQSAFPLGAGPIQIRHQKDHLLINLLLDHTLLIVPLIEGRPEFSFSSRITHDGPIWAFEATIWKGSLIIAAGGVENHPLNRLGGEFGYIDSFLFLYVLNRDQAPGVYRWRPADRSSPGRFAQQNLSEIDLVTPKALRFAPSSKEALELWASAFGSSRLARFEVQEGRVRLTGNFSVPPGTTDFTVVPGRQAFNRANQESHVLTVTNALFDKIYRLEIGLRGSKYQRIPELPSYPSKLSWESRVGELLFYTTLMTPDNRTEGELSRFTCETCHYEGTIDGRVHYTGRKHVFATTKPVRGLANNVPLFSRAGDKSLASMVLAEFRVANQDRRDSFSIKSAKFPWLKEIGNMPAVLSPTDLRTAFLSFFVDFQHRPNPWRVRSGKLSPGALRGLTVFRERCEYCHQATVSTREAESLPYADWNESLEAEEKDLAWGAPFYSKTGIKPYVHRAGARVPSLRRVQQKYPYFTNGSSRTLRDLLSRFRYKDLTAWHHYEPETDETEKVKALTAEETDNLEELLRYF